MTWHFKPLVLAARDFRDGKNYDRKDKYAVIATVQLLGDHRAYISGMLADGTEAPISRRDLADMARGLRAQYGVTEIDAERRGTEKTFDTGPAPLT